MTEVVAKWQKPPNQFNCHH